MALNLNLCGIDAIQNSVETQLESIERIIEAKLEQEASNIISELSGGLLKLNIDIGGLFSGKPTINDISLQAEIKDLGTFTVGSNGYNVKLNSIQARFEKALKAEGLDVLVLVAAALALIAQGKDICDLVPNLTIDENGNITLCPNNVLFSKVLSSDSDFISATINSNGAEINLANAGINARFKCAIEGVKLVLPNFCVVIGESSRTDEETRFLIREADIQIENARLKCGVSINPSDHRAGDIKNSDKNLPDGGIKIGKQLLCVTGSLGSAKVTLENVYNQKIDETLVPLRQETSRYGELLSKSQRPYPDNLDSSGQRVFFSQNTSAFEKHTKSHRSIVRIQNEYVKVLSQNRKSLNNDVNSKQFITFSQDVTTLTNKVKQNIIDFENSFSRDITTTDIVRDETTREVRNTDTLLRLPDISIETDVA